MDLSSTNDLQDRYTRVVEEAARLRLELKSMRERHRVLAQENNYRAASNLQLLAASLFHHRQHAPNPQVRQFAGNTIVQVQAVARVHDRLAGSDGEIELAPFVRAVCTDLSIVWGQPQIRIEFDTDPVAIGADQAASLGLITSELVANAYRHAFGHRQAGSIRLHIKPMTAEKNMLAVVDNGAGLQHDLVKGAGLTAVEMLARSIGGDVSYNQGPGARINIAFPNLAAANRVLDL